MDVYTHTYVCVCVCVCVCARARARARVHVCVRAHVCDHCSGSLFIGGSEVEWITRPTLNPKSASSIPDLCCFWEKSFAPIFLTPLRCKWVPDIGKIKGIGGRGMSSNPPSGAVPWTVIE